MKRLWPDKTTLGYIGVLTGCFIVAMVSGWTPIASQIDNYAYDFLLGWNPPAPVRTEAVIVAIDDATFAQMGGVRRIRSILADAIERVAAGQPKAVATDIILSDSDDAAEDARLAQAFTKIPMLVLATDLTRGRWEDPAPVFAPAAKALGHVYADQASRDGVTRTLALSKTGYRKRRWALSLEAFRLARGSRTILESPEDVEVAGQRIPVRYDDDRPLRILYSRNPLPRISVAALVKDPSAAGQLHDKVVFLGVTSLSFTRDRVVTPYGELISGLEVNAQAFATLERGKFLPDASNGAVVGVCILLAVVAGIIFAQLAGWPAVLAGAILLVAAHTAPMLLFRQGLVFPYFAPLATAWLTVAGAATYQSLVVRRQLRKAEVERARYRQAIQFVTHEMRSPLTAIQGSSEMMGRYNLNEDKRKQIASMINSESKRLARMIQTFLDVERLSDGQMELKRDPLAAQTLVQSCMERVRPLAERKNIQMTLEVPVEGEFPGDRELLEYAVYNLLTNAVKYSPPDTEVTICTRPVAGFLRLSIKDQGMGMDSHEIKRIFARFYRTKRAEASGEAGTGIGLSIVDQIVKHHGGRVEVTSAPGQGSCFTLVLPAHAAAAPGRR